MLQLPDPKERVLPSNVLPGIIRPTTEGERAFNPYSLLLQARIIYLGTPVDDDVSNAVVSQLLYLGWENPDEDIYLYINSPGGSVLDGMAIYDTMQLIKPDVATVCLGKAASMGAVLLSGGTKGKRYCTRKLYCADSPGDGRHTGLGLRHRNYRSGNSAPAPTPEYDPVRQLRVSRSTRFRATPTGTIGWMPRVQSQYGIVDHVLDGITGHR